VRAAGDRSLGWLPVSRLETRSLPRRRRLGRGAPVACKGAGSTVGNTAERLVDEVSFRKRHRYLTVVTDHDTGNVVWVCEGKTSAALLLQAACQCGNALPVCLLRRITRSLIGHVRIHGRHPGRTRVGLVSG
jgi:hypothetical protein